MNWSELFSTVLQGVLIAVLPPLIAAVVRWIWAQASMLWAQIEMAQPTVAQMLEEMAVSAVKAAEQAGVGDYTIDKKEYAMAVIEQWLAVKGLKIDLVLVNAAVEKAVLDVFNSDLIPAPLPTE